VARAALGTPVTGLLAALPVRPGGDWLAARDVRLRVLAAVAFALVTVSMERPGPLLAALAAALVLAGASGLSPGRLARRLLPLQAFLALLLVTLPFTVPGEPILRLGPLGASGDGLVLAITIALKADAVALALLGLLGGLEPVALGHALARLRVPDKLVHLFLMTVRYLDVLQGELARLRQAARARAFVPRSDRHTWRTAGWLVGMLLVRSLERSQRVSAAMKCRGFDGRFHLLCAAGWGRGDTGLALVLGAGLLGLLALEHLPWR
jgi:cobalt/nickel transport system permease protein